FVVSVGMASPYILLTAQPKWMRFLPKPGAWMEHFKEAMGFLLLATVVWLLSVLGQQVGVNGVLNTIAFLLAVAFATWIAGRFVTLSTPALKKSLTYLATLAICLFAYQIFLTPVLNGENVPVKGAAEENNGPLTWVPYTETSLAELTHAGKTV